MVFRSGGSAAVLSERIGAALLKRFKFRPAVMLLQARALKRAAAANPFPECRTTPQYVHLWFLDRPADRSRAEAS